MNPIGSDDFNVFFIEQMRPREELWNRTCNFYGSHRADQMWQLLSQKLGIEVWFLRNRWSELKECYQDELDGMNRKGLLVYKTPWKYTDSLAFLSKAFEHIPLNDQTILNRHQGDNAAIVLQCHGPHFGDAVATGPWPVLTLSSMMPSPPSVSTSSSEWPDWSEHTMQALYAMNGDRRLSMRYSPLSLRLLDIELDAETSYDPSNDEEVMAATTVRPLALATNESQKILVGPPEQPQFGRSAFERFRMKTQQWKGKFVAELQQATGLWLGSFGMCQQQTEVAGIMMTIKQVDGQAQMVEVRADESGGNEKTDDEKEKMVGVKEHQMRMEEKEKDEHVEDEAAQGAAGFDYRYHD